MTNASMENYRMKRIEDLSLREIDMAYSLSRTGWSSAEIGRRYGISEPDVNKLIEDYVELHEWRKANPLNQVPVVDATAKSTTKKFRKRRSDAIYATSKDRQAAYRARLKENHRCSNATVTEGTANQEGSATVSQALANETSPECQVPEPPTGCISCQEYHDSSKRIADPVTVERPTES